MPNFIFKSIFTSCYSHIMLLWVISTAQLSILVLSFKSYKQNHLEIIDLYVTWVIKKISALPFPIQLASEMPSGYSHIMLLWVISTAQLSILVLSFRIYKVFKKKKKVIKSFLHYWWWAAGIIRTSSWLSSRLSILCLGRRWWWHACTVEETLERRLPFDFQELRLQLFTVHFFFSIRSPEPSDRSLCYSSRPNNRSSIAAWDSHNFADLSANVRSGIADLQFSNNLHK